jgi:hypothetical protein
MEKLITRSVHKLDDTIQRRPMKWMLFIMDGNRQEGKWLDVERKTLKWAKANSAPPKTHLDESLW